MQGWGLLIDMNNRYVFGSLLFCSKFLIKLLIFRTEYKHGGRVGSLRKAEIALEVHFYILFINFVTGTSASIRGVTIEATANWMIIYIS